MDLDRAGPRPGREDHLVSGLARPRFDKARTREWGGAGLGLSITRWAVEVHGGDISLKSEEGQGSTFRVSLPVAKHSATSPSKGGSQ